jgi:hypothetical protein
MPEVKVHYDNLAERQDLVAHWEGLGYRMLHDDFDADWKPGDEPHGTMTFTDEPEPVAPDTAIHFVPGTPGQSSAKRIDHIEEFLKQLYP